MAAPIPDGEEMIAGINVTPLVDVTLVLLIIFMVTATYAARQAIMVDLPRAASGGETTGTTLALVLDRGGRLFLNGRETGRDDVRVAARAAAASDPGARVIIGADREVPHGDVVALVDLVKSQGLTRFAIEVERSPAAP